ncbi:MAG: tryptophan-rich sensory protein [Candidatus Marinimicrobia bacterium]|nr:tryptophan-rich sensory protein [Candidatus Neomarinimicrobiota bacterium]
MHATNEHRNLHVFLAVLNFLLFASMLTINALANILPINGLNTGELSALYPNLFVPTGLTFSIWGLIYLLLFIYVIYALIIALKGTKGVLCIKTQLAFALTCLLNGAWIFFWHYKLIGWAECIMLALLITLIYLFQKTGKLESKGFIKTLAVSAPITIYLGWITVATIANTTALLVAKNWGAWGISENVWTITMILIATSITVIMLIKKQKLCYSLVIIWAFVGIFIKRYNAEILYKDILFTLSVSLGLLVIVSLYALIKKRILS